MKADEVAGRAENPAADDLPGRSAADRPGNGPEACDAGSRGGGSSSGDMPVVSALPKTAEPAAGSAEPDWLEGASSRLGATFTAGPGAYWIGAGKLQLNA